MNRIPYQIITEQELKQIMKQYNATPIKKRGGQTHYKRSEKLSLKQHHTTQQQTNIKDTPLLS